MIIIYFMSNIASRACALKSPPVACSFSPAVARPPQIECTSLTAATIFSKAPHARSPSRTPLHAILLYYFQSVIALRVGRSYFVPARIAL